MENIHNLVVLEGLDSVASGQNKKKVSRHSAKTAYPERVAKSVIIAVVNKERTP